MSQIIISVGREFGSGGRYIAEQLSKRFDIPLYDRHLITEIAQKTGMTEEQVNKYNEAPKIKILSRTVNGYSNSIEDNIAEMQFDIIDKKAKDGESFVVVGRCSETKLKEYPALVSLFILGDMDKKIERVKEIYKLDDEDAKKFIKEQLVPMVKVSSPRTIGILSEDFEALEIALSSGNSTLVFAMANYISNVEGLLNGIEVAQRITSKVFD